MAMRRKYDIVIIMAVVLGGLAFACFHQERRLQSSMPLEFFDPNKFSPSKRAAEEKIAAAYWESAVTQVQWKYGYASRLPESPPPEFGISSADVGSIATDETVRRRYWAQLHSTWYVTDAWKGEYAWSSVSFLQWLRSSGEWWGQTTRPYLGK